MKNDILTRYAAVVPVLVEAGCESPFVEALAYISHYAKDEWYVCGHDPFIDRSCRVTNDYACIAVLEQWFHQTVVPWAECEEGELCAAPYWRDGGLWAWHVNGKNGQHPDPTEANIQCLEALAEVIGGKR